MATALTVQEWVAQWGAPWHPGGSRTGYPEIADLAHGGVSEADVAAFAHAHRPDESQAQARAQFCWVMKWVSLHRPDMSAQAATRWALVVARCYQAGTSPVATVLPWLTSGLGEAGWLFFAAGIPVDEAQRMMAAGTVDEDALRRLSALRDSDRLAPG